MESWLNERRRYAEALQQRAQRTGGQAEIAAYERFLRQTARMQATANQLAGALPSPFAMVHGLRLQHQGVEIYLEHLVVGPTGIFLIETMEGDDPTWLTDLGRNIAFFRQALGAHASFFTCLVITRTAQLLELPEGAHVVESLETAVHVVQDQRFGVQFSPALAQEVWHLIEALRARGPIRPHRQRLTDRVGRREWVLIGATLAMNLVLTLIDGDGLLSWFVGMVMLVVPVLLALWAILRLHRESWRKVGVYSLLTVTLLWFLLLASAISSMQNGEPPAG